MPISNKPENYKYIVFDPNYQGVVLTSNDYNEVRNFAQNNKGVHIKYQDTTPRYNNLVAPTLINRPTWMTNRNAYFNQLKHTPDVLILDDKQIERNRAQRQYEENQRRMGVVSKRQDTLRSTEEAEAEQKAKDAYATIQATYNPMAPGYFSANSNTVTPEQAQREITQFYNTTPLGQLTRATAVGSLGGMAFEALPAAAQGALNLEMAYQGAKNLLSDNGVSKTWNKFKQGDYVGGLKSLGGDLFNFTLTLPVSNKVLALGMQPVVNKINNGHNLISKGNYPDYEILTTTPREAILNEYVNPYYNQSKFRLGKLNFPLSKQGLSNNQVDYSPQYKLLWENFVRENYPTDQQSGMVRLFSLLNADKIPLSPTQLTAKADEIAQGAYSRTVRPRLVELLGENNVPKDVIFDQPNILPFYSQQMDDLNSMIDGAAFKPLKSIDFRKKAFNERKNKNFQLNFPIDEAGSHFALSGNNTVNPFMMSAQNPTVSRFLDLLTDTSIHEMTGHGTESLLPAIEYYKYSIPAKKSYFNYDFKKLQNDKKYQYLFDPSELRARIIVAKDMLAQNGSELNSTNLKNALTVIEPKYDKVLSKTGWEWMFRRAINGYTLAPFVIPVGAKFINTDSPEYRNNGGKLISKKQ